MRLLLGLSLLLASVAFAKPKPARCVKLLAAPAFQQSTNYTCGPSAVRALLALYRHYESEEALAKRLACDPENGTEIEAIADLLARHGIPSATRTEATLGDIEASLARGIPVLIVAQAWADPPAGQSVGAIDYRNVWNSGHYQLVVGMDAEFVYLADPWMEAAERGRIVRDEFLRRWHIGSPDDPASTFRGLALFPLVPPPAPAVVRWHRFGDVLWRSFGRSPFSRTDSPPLPEVY